MKTTAHKSLKFPKVYQMIFCMKLIAFLGFLNCLVIKAEGPEKKKKDYENNINLEELVKADAEPELRLEDWMFSFGVEFVTEEAVELEEWILNFNEGYTAKGNIELESWMLNFGNKFTTEDDVKLEDCMLHFNDTFVAEESIELEEWMFDFGHDPDPLYYAKK
jgi:hypothetical protein